MAASSPRDLAWSAVGILLAATSAASTVVGMLLQKQGLARESKTIYRVGILTFAVVKPATQIAALYAAPLSLVAPLASLTILLNAVIVPYFQGEQVKSTSILAGSLLAAGCVGTCIAGAHGGQHWTYAELVALGLQSRLLTTFLFGSLLILTLLLKFHRESLIGFKVGIVLVAALPSLASALNNVMLKVLLHAVVIAPPLLLPVIAAVVGVTAFLQVWSTAIGVDCFDLLTFVPVQISEQIVITTLYSMTFFDERPESKLAFAISSVTILAGILLVVYSPGDSLEGYRRMDEESSKHLDIDQTQLKLTVLERQLSNPWDPGPWGRQVTTQEEPSVPPGLIILSHRQLHDSF